MNRGLRPVSYEKGQTDPFPSDLTTQTVNCPEAVRGLMSDLVSKIKKLTFH